MANGWLGTTAVRTFWPWLGLILACLGWAASGCTPEPVVPSAAPVVDSTGGGRYQGVNPAGQTVRFWHPFTKGQTEALAEIVASFNEENPWDITVTLEAQGSAGQLERKLMGVLNTPAAPDLIIAYPDQAAVYQLSGSLVDLRALFDHPDWGFSEAEQEDFLPGLIEQDVFPTFDGARLGLPAGRALDLLYYNADWLEDLGYNRPPETPEQFQRVACQSVAQPYLASTAPGGSTAVGYALELEAGYFAAWTFAFDGHLYDAQANRYTLADDAPQAALTFLQDLLQTGCARLAAGRYAAQTDFGQGRLLFLVASSAGLAAIESEVEAGARFKWGVAALPHRSAQPQVNAHGPSLSIPRSQAEKELAAWLFMRYFSSPEVQAGWAAGSGLLPARGRALNLLQDGAAEGSPAQALLDLAPYARSEPFLPGYRPVRQKMAEAMAAVAAGEDPGPVLTALDRDANQILAEQAAACLPTAMPAD